VDDFWCFATTEVLAYVDLKDGARAQALAEYEKLAQDNTAPANLRQRATGIAEYLKANPDRGAPASTSSGTPQPAPLAQGTKPQ